MSASKIFSTEAEVIDKIEPTPTPEKKISLNDTQIAEIEDQTYIKEPFVRV